MTSLQCCYKVQTWNWVVMCRLGEEERWEMVNNLKLKWAATNAQYQALSFVLDTESKKKRKERSKPSLLFSTQAAQMLHISQSHSKGSLLLLLLWFFSFFFIFFIFFIFFSFFIFHVLMFTVQDCFSAFKIINVQFQFSEHSLLRRKFLSCCCCCFCCTSSSSFKFWCSE